METKQYSYNDVEVASNGDGPDLIGIEQLRHLVHLLDRSDVSEVEVKHIGDGTRLVLRKTVASDELALLSNQVMPQPAEEAGELEPPKLNHRGVASDGGEIAHVSIAKRRW